MLCLGRTVGVIVAGRLLQGLSAAMVWTVGLALLVDTVGQEHIGQILGYVSISLSLGVLVAPVLGGVVYERGSYFSVFAMSFGVIGLDIVLRLVMIEKKIAKRWLPAEEDTIPEPSGVEDVVHNASTGLEHGLHNPGEARIDKEGSATDHPPSATEKSTPSPESTAAVLASDRKPRIVDRLPPVVTMLKSRRLLTGLWCTLVESVLLTCFESVS